MKKVLAVIDVQQDFVTGALGTLEAQQAMPALIKKVREFDGEIVLTMDTHGADYLSTQEGRHLPVAHCIENSAGWKLMPELDAVLKDKPHRIFRKPTFGSLPFGEYLADKFNAGELESVEFVGFCTDICVVSNILLLKALVPELPISIDPACCAGVSPERHHAALEVLASCQIGAQAHT